MRRFGRMCPDGAWSRTGACACSGHSIFRLNSSDDPASQRTTRLISGEGLVRRYRTQCCGEQAMD